MRASLELALQQITFFCLQTLMKLTCAFRIYLSYSPIAKKTRVLLAFAHTYVLLSPDFDDIDNTPRADFTKGLKPRFRLKFETLVLNFVNRMLSLWSYT